MNLEKLAQGQQCMIRIAGICNHDPSTTVLAHLRMAGISGAGLKAPSLLAAWSCSACHDEIDRRTRITSKDAAELAHLQGIMRTQYEYIKAGLTW